MVHSSTLHNTCLERLRSYVYHVTLMSHDLTPFSPQLMDIEGSRWLSGKVLALEPGRFQVRNPIPPMIRRVFGALYYARSYIGGPAGVARKLGGGEASSGVNRPRFKIARLLQNGHLSLAPVIFMCIE
ncbi:hypothetical protein AVEN_178941-1 [Araneus ventricosus]|uniref:Uncharacterized protein n=1 Tax=Araneus ventricosus TaxID=182803 RepID=A0A4Y1ZRN0_ARAVE|nr:hypothetical protein AVEN_178941-1 [Araneus ventricosus]